MTPLGVSRLSGLVYLLATAVWVVGVEGCLPDGASEEVTIGEETYVCVTLGPLNWFGNGTSLRIAATPTADAISSVNVRNAWSDPEYARDIALSRLGVPFAAGAGMGVTVSSMGKLSYQRAYRSVRGSGGDLSGVTFPLLMAVVHVDRGAVTGVTWDSSCSWCEAEQCAQSVYGFDGTEVASGGNCFVEDSSCSTDEGTTRLCELNVNIVWTGTDSQDRYFLSSTPRFSRLTEEQLTDYTDRLDGESMKVDFKPTGQPTSLPTAPSGEPTARPTSPSSMPTGLPSAKPSPTPSAVPTGEPSAMPTGETV